MEQKLQNNKNLHFHSKRLKHTQNNFSSNRLMHATACFTNNFFPGAIPCAVASVGRIWAIPRLVPQPLAFKFQMGKNA